MEVADAKDLITENCICLISIETKRRREMNIYRGEEKRTAPSREFLGLLALQHCAYEHCNARESTATTLKFLFYSNYEFAMQCSDIMVIFNNHLRVVILYPSTQTNGIKEQFKKFVMLPSKIVQYDRRIIQYDRRIVQYDVQNLTWASQPTKERILERVYFGQLRARIQTTAHTFHRFADSHRTTLLNRPNQQQSKQRAAAIRESRHIPAFTTSPLRKSQSTSPQIHLRVLRQSESAEELTAAALDSMPAIALLLLLLLPLAADLENAAFHDLNLNLLLLDAREIGLEDVRLRRFLPVDACVGESRNLVRVIGAWSGEGVVEDGGDALEWVPDVEGEGVEDVAPANDRHLF
ncbi:hypothetical protein IEQ34_005068 [Dendrobium chrysotoxum]|uniref:Uncharacterized protein n=1 Tax=Dendrobium chrysotoxum TaxID=161865 RepID=A0AAV7HA35_DENCH|nr:hypothetical protein IEQ34_005068 [Dendrobium chrysotoxum]